MGVKQTFCYVAGDLSNLSGQDFFDEMTKRNWLFLEDNTGAKKEAGDLPLRVSGLQDDPYRSFAGEVRDAGGFGKTCEPFAEFRWADFFLPADRTGSSDQRSRSGFERGEKRGGIDLFDPGF